MVDAFTKALLLPVSETGLQSYGEESDPVETKLLNYFWNLELSQAFYPLLQAFEVAFRNAIHEAIRNHSQNDRWFEDSALKACQSFTRISSTRYVKPKKACQSEASQTSRGGLLLN